jgi:hypothetical protein
MKFSIARRPDLRSYYLTCPYFQISKLVTGTLGSLLCTLALLAGCSGGSKQDSTGARQSEMPLLPGMEATGSSFKHVSELSEYQVDVTTPLAFGGESSRVETPSFVAAGEIILPWAMYGVTLLDAARPISLDVAVSPAPVTVGGTDQPVAVFIGVANYSALRWEWSGPYDTGSIVTLNSLEASTNPQRVNSADTFFFVVAAGTPDGQPLGPAAARIDSATLLTSLQYSPMLPGAVPITLNTGNDKGPPTPEDPMYISIHWTHVPAKSPEDEVNVVDSYKVFRRSPGGQFALIGQLPSPEDLYVDPIDNDAGVGAPAPATSYDYYVIGENEQGASGHSGYGSIKSADISGGVWTTHRGSNQRTSYNPDVSISGVLSLEWDIDTAPGTGQDSIEPLVNYNGDILYVGGYKVFEYAFADGGETNSWPGFGPLNGFAPATLFGNKVAFPGDAAGLNVLNTTDGVIEPLASSGKVWAAPLYMDGNCIFGDRAGTVHCYRVFDGEPLWQFTAPGPQPFSLSPVADQDYVYFVDDSGRLFKLDASTGAEIDSLLLQSAPVGDSLALDFSRGMLWLGTVKSALNAVSTSGMSVVRTWTVTPWNEQCTAPAVLHGTDPPLVVTAYSKDISHTQVLAVDAEMLTTSWTHDIDASPPEYVSACADAILLTKKNREAQPGSELVLLTLEGAEFQRLPLDNASAGAVIPINNHVLVPLKNDAHLRLYEAIPLTRPKWQDEDIGLSGIQNFSGGDTTDSRDDMRVSWHTAYHPDGLTVRYALLYAEGHPPMLEEPFTDTTVISGLTNADNNTTLIYDLPLGPRYYAAIRAYVGTWGTDELTDLNNNVLGCTPPWIELANYAPNDEKIARMEMIYTSAQRMYGLANVHGSEATRVFYQGSQGHSEGFDTGLDAYSADGVGISYFNFKPFAAMANAGVLSVAERNFPGTWFEPVVISGATPVYGSPLKLRVGTESGLAYSQYISGAEPTSEVDYYAVHHDGTDWGSPVPVETANTGGRDLDAMLNPTDPAKLWVAYQKGSVQAASLPTCTAGQLWFARGNGDGTFSKELVDAGTNGASSDCGKRVRMALNGSNPCLAYLDLNASNTEPRGRLKYASYNGSAWQVSTVDSFDLSQQDGEYRSTYGEIGFMVTGGVPVIALLERQLYSSDPAYPTVVQARVYIKNGANWSEEIPTDPKPTLLNDREPCFIKPDDLGTWLLYFVAPWMNSDTEPGRTILRLERIN